MRKRPRKIRLEIGVELANEASEVVKTQRCNFYLSEVEGDVQEACIKPNKLSALHHFLFAVYRFNIVDRIKSSIFEDHDIELVIEYLEKKINEFGLDIDLNEQFASDYDEEDDKDEYESIVDSIMYNPKVIEGFVDSGFHILFLNRDFLHDFNLYLSEFLEYSGGFKEGFADSLNSKGKIKRVRFPEWLKEAVYHRDKGRCVLYSKDLSGIINSDVSKQIDHIIPLSFGEEKVIGGTNILLIFNYVVMHVIQEKELDIQQHQ